MDIISAAIEFLTHDAGANQGNLHRVLVGTEMLTRGQVCVMLGQVSEQVPMLQNEVTLVRSTNADLRATNHRITQRICDIEDDKKRELEQMRATVIVLQLDISNMHNMIREACERATRIDMSGADYVASINQGVTLKGPGHETFTATIPAGTAPGVLLESLAGRSVPTEAINAFAEADVTMSAAVRACELAHAWSNPASHHMALCSCVNDHYVQCKHDGNGRPLCDPEADGDHDQGAQ